jgi:hypothetical protein
VVTLHADRIMRSGGAALAAFVLLAAVHTWPLASNPAHLSRNDNGDTVLNTWAIAWVAHQLPRAPAHLFDANIFYPERHTLGYSEAMVVQGVMAMPVLAAGGSPVLAYNLVLMAGFALTGWAFWMLAVRWTGSVPAAYVSGCLAAFNAHVLVRLPHLQTQHVEFIALALFALDRVLASPRAKDAVMLGVAFALQGLTSVYLLVFTTWLLLFAVWARAGDWLRRDRWRTVVWLGAAGATAVVLLLPYLLAYAEVHRLQGFERTVDDARGAAGSWVDYLATGGRIHYELWSAPFVARTISANFPGITAVVLVALSLTWPETRGDRRLRMCLGAAAGCMAVSFAPRASFFPVLYRVIPLFWAVRVESHIGQMVLLMIAVAAGFGVAGLLRRIPAGGRRAAAALALLLLVNVEALRAPFEYTPFSRISHVYDLVAADPHAIVVELPFYEGRISFASATYMLNSTRNWRPMLNGYSGFRPESYDVTFERLQGFPDVASLQALRERGVTHVVIHGDQMGADARAAIARTAALQLLEEEDNLAIYHLR